MATGEVLLHLGRAAFRLFKFDEAVEAGERALAIAERHLGKQGPAVATVLNLLGDAYHGLARHKQALAAYQRSLLISSKLNGTNHPLVGYAHRDIATVYASMSRFEEARINFSKAISLMSGGLGPDNLDLARVRLSQGEVLSTLGQPQLALFEFEGAAAVFAKTYGFDSVDFASARARAAVAHFQLARYDTALLMLRQSLAVFSANLNPDDVHLADAHANIAAILAALGKHEAALVSYAEARRIYEVNFGSDDMDVATVRMATGPVLSLLGRDREALAELQAAFPVLLKTFGEDHMRVAILTSNIAIAYDQLGRGEEALTYHDQALGIVARTLGPASPEITRLLINKTNTLERIGRYEEAFRLALRALIVYKANSSEILNPLPGIYYVLARNLRQLGEGRAATLFARLTINTQQSLRVRNQALSNELRASFASTARDAYWFLTEREIDDGAFAGAQFAGSLMKSSELDEYAGQDGIAAPRVIRLTKTEQRILNELELLIRAPVKAAKAQQVQFLKQSAQEKASAKVTARARRLAEEFNVKSHDAAEAARRLFAHAEAERRSNQGEQLALNLRYAADLQKQLAAFSGEAALYQAIATDHTLHLFISSVGRDTIHRELAIERTELARLVNDTVISVETRAEDADAKLTRLYDLLIRPVADDLAAVKPRVLMLNLSGFLRYTPYAALKSERGYFVEDYALALDTPAAGTNFDAPAAVHATAAGFGVSAAHDGFASLPGVERELEAIFTGADRVGAIPGLPQLDSHFTVLNLKAALRAKPRYLHIASHFKFVPGNENSSFLLLGTGEHLDLGQLRSDPELRFSGVDLLTLSACETARGGGAEGEEIESFGALAQQNGASAVMATLWQIADNSTANLMADFYQGRVAEGLDKATALQRAQITMIKGKPATEVASRGERAMTLVDGVAPAATLASKTSHPYHWSAFILMGNWR